MKVLSRIGFSFTLVAAFAACTNTGGRELAQRHETPAHLHFESSIVVVDVSSRAGLEVQIRGPFEAADVALGTLYISYRCRASTASANNRASLNLSQPGHYSLACTPTGELSFSQPQVGGT